MKLSIKDRVVLPGVLVLTAGKKLPFLREVQSLISDMEIGALEKSEIRWTAGPQGITWNNSPEYDVEFSVSPEMVANICDCFKKLENAQPSLLMLEHVSTYERFLAIAEDSKSEPVDIHQRRA